MKNDDLKFLMCGEDDTWGCEIKIDKRSHVDIDFRVMRVRFANLLMADRCQMMFTPQYDNNRIRELWMCHGQNIVFCLKIDNV